MNQEMKQMLWSEESQYLTELSMIPKTEELIVTKLPKDNQVHHFCVCNKQNPRIVGAAEAKIFSVTTQHFRLEIKYLAQYIVRPFEKTQVS